MVRVELVEYTEDGERIAIQMFKGVSTTVRLAVADAENIVAEALRKRQIEPWKLSHYVFEVECSASCVNTLVRYGVPSSGNSHGIPTLREFLRELGNAVGRPCTESDFVCHALNVETYERRFSSLPNEVEEDIAMRLIDRYFFVPASARINREVRRSYVRTLLSAVWSYLVMVGSGMSHEDASYLLPQSTTTRVVLHLSAWDLVANLLPALMCSGTPAELRCVAWRMWSKLETVHPLLFGYAGPACIGLENAARDTPVKLRDVLDEDKPVEFTVSKCPMGVPRERIRTCVVNTFKSTFNL